MLTFLCFSSIITIVIDKDILLICIKVGNNEKFSQFGHLENLELVVQPTSN